LAGFFDAGAYTQGPPEDEQGQGNQEHGALAS